MIYGGGTYFYKGYIIFTGVHNFNRGKYFSDSLGEGGLMKLDFSIKTFSHFLCVNFFKVNATGGLLELRVY